MKSNISKKRMIAFFNFTKYKFEQFLMTSFVQQQPFYWPVQLPILHCSRPIASSYIVYVILSYYFKI